MVLVVDAAPLHSRDQLDDALARTFERRGSSSSPWREALPLLLAGRDACLVLDNCEHLIEPCARLVEDVLSLCSTLKVVAASHVRLFLPGEAVVELPPLALPAPSVNPGACEPSEATELFVARAATAGIDLADGDAAEVPSLLKETSTAPLESASHLPGRHCSARRRTQMMSMPVRAVSLLLHLYVVWRIAPALGSTAAGIAFALLLMVSALSLPFGFGARREGRASGVARALAWLGLVCMGLFSSLFVLTVARDLGLAVVAAIDAAWPGTIPFASVATASARVVPMAAALITFWGFVNARRTARVVRVDVPVAGLPDALNGFSIAQISDVHVGPTIRREYLERVVAEVNALDADLVAVTGDLVDGSVRDLAEHVAPLSELRSREGTFFVTGNHEYYSGAAQWVRELRRLGVTVLMNQHVDRKTRTTQSPGTGSPKRKLTPGTGPARSRRRSSPAGAAARALRSLRTAAS